MREELLEQAATLLGKGADDPVVELLCDAACCRLDGLLADDVTEQDCAEAYSAAALWLVLSWGRDMANWQGIASLSAGDLQARLEGGKSPLEGHALRLMAPWLKDRSFVFLGVRG